jgi:hypothetical protein
MDEDVPEDVVAQSSPPRPQMLDEGCQTAEVEVEQAIPEPVEKTVSQGEVISVPVEIPVPVPQERSATPTQEEQAKSHQIEHVSTISAPEEETIPMDQEAQVSAAQKQPSPIPQVTPAKQLPEQLPEKQPEQLVEQRPEQPAEEQPAGQQPRAEGPQPPLTPLNTEFPSTLFGTPKSLSSSFSMFGAGAPARAESALSLSDQVRFGFSHIPQTTRSPVPSPYEPAPAPSYDNQDAYPVSYLDDAPTPTKYADMNTSLNAADEQGEMPGQGQIGAPEPPLVENFGHGQWEMSTQSPHYNPIEGGHFGADALDEGTPVIAEQAPLHTNDIDPGKVPEGFASYGPENVFDRRRESPHQEIPIKGQEFVENEETISGDEVGVDEEEEEDAAQDEFAYGERIEEGDYDQRNYDIPSDDEEGLSEQSDEIELEAEERYGNGEIYDDEGEEWDEEEEEYDESEEDDYEEGDDMPGYQPKRPTAPAPPKEPVVISLLSDSEDDDEPAPTPSKPPAAPKAAPIQYQPKPSTASEEVASARRSVSRGALELAQTETTSPKVGERHPPDILFGQTHIVDFGASFHDGNSGKSGVPAADMDAITVSSSSTNDAPTSFRVSDTQGYSDAPRHEPAPSESSSEGLFVSQLRTEYVHKVHQQISDGSTDESEETDGESADGNEEEESDGQEQVGPEDEHMSVEEVEEDKNTMTHDSDDDLPDAEDSSFVSQVEMIEMTEEVVEDEDEDMTESNVPSKVEDTVETVRSELRVEEVGAFDEDVDMIDAASTLMTVSTEDPSLQSLQQEVANNTSGPASSAVFTEAVAEVVVTTTSELPPSPQPTPQQDAQTPAAIVSDGQLASTESAPDALEDVPIGGSGGSKLVQVTPTQTQLTGDEKPQVQHTDHLGQSIIPGQASSSPSKFKSDTEFLDHPMQKRPQSHFPKA